MQDEEMAEEDDTEEDAADPMMVEEPGEIEPLEIEKYPIFCLR